MSIGIVTTWFERGAAYVSKQYVDTLSKKHDVCIYARGGEKQAQHEKIWASYNVTWGDRQWAKDKSKENEQDRLKHFKQWILDNHLDTVFFNEEHMWPAILLCNEMGVKTGAYVDYYTKETVPLFGVYDFLICNTKRHYSVFKRHLQAYYIPWGTDIELFKPKSYDLVEPGTIRFFHSAGMNPKRKGTDTLVRMFDILSLRHDNVKLIIHTQVSLIAFFPELKGAIERLSKQGKLLYVEDTIEAPGLYHLGDVYVYPTTLEGIGLTVMEALASGLPVIVSNNGPMNEFVDEHNGRLVNIKRCYKRYFDHYYWPVCEADEDHLLQSMEYYVQNSNRIKEFKENARKSAEVRMNWAVNEGAVLSAFEKSEIITDKIIASKKVKRLEWIKDHPVSLLFYKIKTLQFDVFPILIEIVKKKLME